jgi:hypothetical protein
MILKFINKLFLCGLGFSVSQAAEFLIFHRCVSLFMRLCLDAYRIMHTLILMHVTSAILHWGIAVADIVSFSMPVLFQVDLINDMLVVLFALHGDIVFSMVALLWVADWSQRIRICFH